MVSDLKSDLVMTTCQRRPNVQLFDNAAINNVCSFDECAYCYQIVEVGHVYVDK